MPATTISAPKALRLLLEKPGLTRAVDVRSEGEFAEAAVPGFVNLPILTNPERHEVGTCYKQRGQEAAIALGHELTAAHKAARTEGWKSALAGAEFPLLTCFRGGLRSKLACEWARAAGARPLQVEGGYKAMRHELLQAVESSPEMLVICGPTGSGKSELLRSVSGAGVPVLDLEHFANHKGSAFGGNLLRPQPSQATFENLVGMDLLRKSPRLVEDESALIGHLAVPATLRQRISGGRVVRITMGQHERANRIFKEYVAEPLAEGVAAEALCAHYGKALRNISKRLGGQATAELEGKVQLAFKVMKEPAHLEWILALLALYYDKAYEYSFKRLPRETAFEGDWEQCKQWIQDKFA